MTPAESLAMLVATGVQAEAVVRATVESLDADWQRHTATLNANPSKASDCHDALIVLEAIGPYRALLGAVVATWDGPAEGTTVVQIGGAS